jgi:glycosyltransferase involved in cell wall biosynthesis
VPHRRSILFLTYDLELASFRYRTRSLYRELEAAGWAVRELELETGRYLARTWRLRHQLRASDVVLLQQIKLATPEAVLLASLAGRTVLDFDDAIYLRKPRVPGGPAGDSAWRRRKFAATCRVMDLVVAGNEELAAEARRFARSVAIVPTAIDVDRYPATPPAAGGPPTVVWIGRPENLIYLELVRPALVEIASRHPDLRLRVICSEFPDWPEVNVERVPWSTSEEVSSLATADLGIMPLGDDGWSRGKCAFKLLQYMAAGLPTVASPVGANLSAVVEGETGWFATDTASWAKAIERVLESPERGRRMGAAGRARAEARYSMETFRASYARLLGELVER